MMYELMILWNYTAKRISLIDLDSEDRGLHWESAQRSWIDEAQALVDHFQSLITQAVCLVDLSPKQRRTVLHQAKTDSNKYSKQIRDRRVGQFHGIVDSNPIRAIAEDGLWELNIASGHTPATLHSYWTKHDKTVVLGWMQLHAKGHFGAVQEFSEIVARAVDGLGWQN